MTPTTEKLIEEKVKEFKEKFWNDESELRSWMLKQSTQRPEEGDFILDALSSIAEQVRKETIEEIEKNMQVLWINKGDVFHGKQVIEKQDILSLLSDMKK